MGSFFSKQPQPQCPPTSSLPNPRRYLTPVIGLDDVGKTNILRRLCPRKDDTTPFLLQTRPTVGIDSFILPPETLSRFRHHHHYVPLSSNKCEDKGKTEKVKDEVNRDSSTRASSSPSSSSSHNNNTTTTTVTTTTTITNASKQEQEYPPESDTKNIRLIFYDLPGQSRYRQNIRSIARPSNALIFVLDATSTPARFQESTEFLHEILDTWIPDSHQIPLLIFANKMDRPEARTVQEVKDQLRLGLWAESGYVSGEGGEGRKEEQRKKEDERVWRLQGASAATGEGLMEGIDWLVVQLEVQRQEKDRRLHQLHFQ